MTVHNHKHFRRLVQGYRWLVVRIWWSSFEMRGGYSVLSQSTDKSEALGEALKSIRGGSVVIRDRVTGQRFSVAEFEKIAV